ncbi:MAG: nickel-dependent lactate racemase [Clostridia bacterium]|nr:nickel-dependent lactate racemase [Clostridia bacterium]
MNSVSFLYGKESIEYDFEEENLLAVLTSSLEEFRPADSGEALVEEALRSPIDASPLSELARGKKRIVLIASDHTRPVPSRVLIPPMLREIRKGNPEADVTILIATGCHRGTTREELIQKFGKEIVEREKIVVHDCDDGENLVSIGTLPSGGDCVINRLAAEADLLVAEGFIEPHFFAGFSGGRKSVLPGICGRNTVLGNHCSEFIAHPAASTGVLENNPIHRDMLWAAKKAKLAFIVNVVLNSEKEILFAVAGDVEAAHQKGCEFLLRYCKVLSPLGDIVISTNGGFPLDQNVYQAVKGMTAAEGAVKEGGVIIMLALCADGVGGDHFYRQLTDEPNIEKTMRIFLARGREETLPDQWQTQILLRVLMRARVILVSEIDPKTVEKMHMIPASSLKEALDVAKKIVGKEKPEIVAIPDGVGVVVRA